jgi:hypothetical protein
MYLVFTVAQTARTSPATMASRWSACRRQYVKDVLGGKTMSWQTVIGRTSNVPPGDRSPHQEENRSSA